LTYLSFVLDSLEQNALVSDGSLDAAELLDGRVTIATLLRANRHDQLQREKYWNLHSKKLLK
jgi:hypothetical protein